MHIETVDDLADAICNWMSCYGGCKETPDGDGCENKNTFCCRIGAMLVLPDRIRKAVENDIIMDALNGTTTLDAKAVNVFIPEHQEERRKIFEKILSEELLKIPRFNPNNLEIHTDESRALWDEWMKRKEEKVVSITMQQSAPYFHISADKWPSDSEIEERSEIYSKDHFYQHPMDQDDYTETYKAAIEWLKQILLSTQK